MDHHSTPQNTTKQRKKQNKQKSSALHGFHVDPHMRSPHCQDTEQSKIDAAPDANKVNGRKRILSGRRQPCSNPPNIKPLGCGCQPPPSPHQSYQIYHTRPKSKDLKPRNWGMRHICIRSHFETPRQSCDPAKSVPQKNR